MAAAAGAATEADAAPAEAKGGLFSLTKKKLMIVGPVALLLLGGGAYMGGFIGGGAPAEEAAAAGEHGEPARTAYFLDLPDMTVNLNSPDRRATYLKLSIALELGDAAAAAAITEFMPRILDAFQVLLREVRLTDLQGSAGIYRLKEELRRRVNLAIYPASVDGVLFKEILIQ